MQPPNSFYSSLESLILLKHSNLFAFKEVWIELNIFIVQLWRDWDATTNFNSLTFSIDFNANIEIPNQMRKVKKTNLKPIETNVKYNFFRWLWRLNNLRNFSLIFLINFWIKRASMTFYVTVLWLQKLMSQSMNKSGHTKLRYL